MRNSTVFLVLFASATHAWGQWGEPVNLGANINSGSFEFGQCLSSLEDTIIFASDRPGGKGGYDLWFSWKEKGEWVPARSMGDSINSPWSDGSPFLSSDGKHLYFSSNRPNGPGDFDIYIAERKKGVWQSPSPLPSPVNTTHSEGWPCLNQDGGSLYFSSDRHGGKGHLDLWVAEKKDGKWSEPLNLGDSVNGPGWESSSTLSSDGQELFFRRDTVTCTKPSAIWRSVKRNGAWQRAVKQGPPINEEDIRVASPFLSRDGNRLYFNSDGKPSFGLTDIFVSEHKRGEP